MKISVIIPVLNEESSIEQVLIALASQTLLPTEVIIVDGGSKDETIERLNSFQETNPSFELRVLKEPKANRSKARNIGIEHAHHKIIALTDAGCVPKKDWLAKLTKPFLDDPETQVVAGFYDPSPKNWFEDTLAEFTCIRDWNFDHNTFLPSSRSLALKKEIWEEVGKYPEELDTCEDLVFADRLKKHAQHWKVVKDAQVVWDQPKNLQQLADKIFSYASGDLDAKYERHVAKIHKAKWRIIVLLGFAFPILYSSFWPLRVIGIAFFLLYMMGTITKHLRMLKYPQNVVILPLIQLVVDAALVQALVFHTIGARYKK